MSTDNRFLSSVGSARCERQSFSFLSPISATFSCTMSDEETPFAMTDWATTHKLKRKTTEALAKEDFSELAVLKAMTAGDVAHLDLTQGQARALKLALAALGNTEFSVVRSEGRDKESDRGAVGGHPAGSVSEQAVLESGQMLDRLLREDEAEDHLTQPVLADPAGSGEGATGNAPTSSSRVGYGKAARNLTDDPRISLTVRASVRKALQIKDYLIEAVRNRLSQRKKESLMVTEGTDGTLSIRTDGSPRVYISMPEWGAANMRLMANLLAQGRLQCKDVSPRLEGIRSIAALIDHQIQFTTQE